MVAGDSAPREGGSGPALNIEILKLEDARRRGQLGKRVHTLDLRCGREVPMGRYRQEEEMKANEPTCVMASRRGAAGVMRGIRRIHGGFAVAPCARGPSHCRIFTERAQEGEGKSKE